jgi:hypothetical protein
MSSFFTTIFYSILFIVALILLIDAVYGLAKGQLWPSARGYTGCFFCILLLRNQGKTCETGSRKRLR